MESRILCSLLSQRIDPTKFMLFGLEVRWNKEEYNTPENRAIVQDVINNYDTLAAEIIRKTSIVDQILALEALQTPRRYRESLIDPTWMKNLESQIADLRSQL